MWRTFLGMRGRVGFAVLVALLAGCLEDGLPPAGSTGVGGGFGSPFPLGSNEICSDLGAPCAKATPTVLVSDQADISDIAVDATSLYWGTPAGIFKADKDGKGQTTLVPLESEPVSALTVDATSVYFIVDPFDPNSGTVGRVMKVAKDGTGLTTLATHQAESSSAGIAVDATSVYWTDVVPGPDGVVMKVGIDGGPATKLVVGVGNVAGIAVDETSVYWAGWGLSKVAKDGGQPVQLTPDAEGGAIALDDANVYWSDEGGILHSVPKAGGASVNRGVISEGSAFDVTTGRIALDGAKLYWTSSLTIDGTALGVALRAVDDGGALVTLGSAPAGPTYASFSVGDARGASIWDVPIAAAYGIAVDETSVYWTSPSNGTVSKAPK